MAKRVKALRAVAAVASLSAVLTNKGRSTSEAVRQLKPQNFNFKNSNAPDY